MIDEQQLFRILFPVGLDHEGIRHFQSYTCSLFSGILQGNESALTVMSDSESAPVPVTMQRNKQGSTCPATILTLHEWDNRSILTDCNVGMIAILRKCYNAIVQ